MASAVLGFVQSQNEWIVELARELKAQKALVSNLKIRYRRAISPHGSGALRQFK